MVDGNQLNKLSRTMRWVPPFILMTLIFSRFYKRTYNVIHSVSSFFFELLDSCGWWKADASSATLLAMGSRKNIFIYIFNGSAIERGRGGGKGVCHLGKKVFFE